MIKFFSKKDNNEEEEDWGTKALKKCLQHAQQMTVEEYSAFFERITSEGILFFKVHCCDLKFNMVSENGKIIDTDPIVTETQGMSLSDSIRYWKYDLGGRIWQKVGEKWVEII